MTVQEMEARLEVLRQRRMNVLFSYGYGPVQIYYADLDAIRAEMDELYAKIDRAVVKLDCPFCLDEKSVGCAWCGGTGKYIRIDNNVMAAMAEER